MERASPHSCAAPKRRAVSQLDHDVREPLARAAGRADARVIRTCDRNENRPRSFDAVVSIKVLEHMQAAFKCLEPLARGPPAAPSSSACCFEHHVDAAAPMGFPDMLHLVRMRRAVLDWLPADMNVTFTTCQAGRDGVSGTAAPRGARNHADASQ